MKILILEDNIEKRNEIEHEILLFNSEVSIDTADNFMEFTQSINRVKFDLIIIDLVIPHFPKNKDDKKDMSEYIIESLRHPTCPNLATPAFGLTEFLDKAEGNFAKLNAHDIVIITYTKTRSEWKDLLLKKIRDCTPKKTYDAVIICALKKEADAFKAAGFPVRDAFIHNNLSCSEIDIGAFKGVIVTLPNMGLVNSAICSALSIEYFSPQIICMSGICAGLEEKTKIYDVVIPYICHQHDFGKWTEEGFKYESSHIQIDHNLKMKIEHLIQNADFNKRISSNLNLSKIEFPHGVDNLIPRCMLAAASSGNSVVGTTEMVSSISSQGRKLYAFEMETFALYEAARTSIIEPLFFSAKSVVDNGNEHKSDDYHRVACLLSAKVTFDILMNVIKSNGD
ncbi:phosphorylase family protein [Aeromonas hydrophila]|uniref:phosphorylase family protein n=1 Tax=Aeromonas hydrophila TaxID=644 RepID=UPI002B49E714|nr:hypothetical protein [Aeromonas hydrophila]